MLVGRLLMNVTRAGGGGRLLICRLMRAPTTIAFLALF
jgi:hypothetical protein